MRVQPCTLLFLRRNDEILLAMKKRGLGQGRFNGVGGKIEPGETVEQAMVRECQEEVEVTPTQFTQVARLDFLMDSNSAEPWRLDGHVFVATHWQGEPTETEEMAPQWFKLSDIPYDQMWEDDSLWLPQVLEGKLIQASFAFDSSETMVNSLVEVVEKL
jgi:mutator protein MutT